MSESRQSKSGKFFLAFFVVLIVISVGATFFRIYLKKDYQIISQTDCDPSAEKCFVHICDPETDGECKGNPEEDTFYYKIISKNASQIPNCDPNSEECAPLACEEGEDDCEITLCSP